MSTGAQSSSPPGRAARDLTSFNGGAGHVHAGAEGVDCHPARATRVSGGTTDCALGTAPGSHQQRPRVAGSVHVFDYTPDGTILFMYIYLHVDRKLTRFLCVLRTDNER